MKREGGTSLDDNVFKKRAILVDFNLLRDNHGDPNYFLLKLCDNLEVSEYSDLIILAENPIEARQWADQNCVGDHNLCFRTSYDLSEDVQTIKQSHKTIGAIVSNRFSVEGVNQRLVQIMMILGK